AVLLKEVVDSRKTGNHLYIVARHNAATHEGHNYILVDQKELLKTELRKLPIEEIVKLSSQILLTAYADFGARRESYTARILYGLYQHITSYVLQLIDLRERKNWGITNLLLRGTAWSLSRASSWIQYQSELTKKITTDYQAIQRQNSDLRVE